jgi:hypothetical protein
MPPGKRMGGRVGAYARGGAVKSCGGTEQGMNTSSNMGMSNISRRYKSAAEPAGGAINAERKKTSGTFSQASTDHVRPKRAMGGVIAKAAKSEPAGGSIEEQRERVAGSFSQKSKMPPTVNESTSAKMTAGAGSGEGRLQKRQQRGPN